MEFFLKKGKQVEKGEKSANKDWLTLFVIYKP